MKNISPQVVEALRYLPHLMKFTDLEWLAFSLWTGDVGPPVPWESLPAKLHLKEDEFERLEKSLLWKFELYFNGLARNTVSVQLHQGA